MEYSNWSFTARVIKGRQIGRKIGFPTANLENLKGTFELNRGVYGVKVFINGCKHIGIMNVGTRPTFNEKDLSTHYEVHIFDFDDKVYGSTLKIDICFYIREERKFKSINQLLDQLYKDKKIALNRFECLSIEEG